MNELLWTSLTELKVSWSPLSLEEARGFITSYSVSYSSDDGQRRRDVEAGTVSVPGDQSSVSLTGLDSDRRYSISVAAATAAGGGVLSDPMSPPGQYYTLLSMALITTVASYYIHIAVCYVI